MFNHYSKLDINVYLAGKIGQNDWRHGLIPALRGHTWSDGPIHCGGFNYVGPFFVSCDHGCNHGPNSHGAVNEDPFACQEPPYTKMHVLTQNNESLDKADLVFAYITSTDCYGTLVELGRATNAFFDRPRIVIAFAPDIPSDDFWYANMQADAVHYNVRSCCLPELLAAEAELCAGH